MDTTASDGIPDFRKDVPDVPLRMPLSEWLKLALPRSYAIVLTFCWFPYYTEKGLTFGGFLAIAGTIGIISGYFVWSRRWYFIMNGRQTKALLLSVEKVSTSDGSTFHYRFSYVDHTGQEHEYLRITPFRRVGRTKLEVNKSYDLLYNPAMPDKVMLMADIPAMHVDYWGTVRFQNNRAALAGACVSVALIMGRIYLYYRYGW